MEDLHAAGGQLDAHLQQTLSLDAMERAAGMTRGRLSADAVDVLYGRSCRMSASCLDKMDL